MKHVSKVMLCTYLNFQVRLSFFFSPLLSCIPPSVWIMSPWPVSCVLLVSSRLSLTSALEHYWNKRRSRFTWFVMSCLIEILLPRVLSTISVVICLFFCLWCVSVTVLQRRPQAWQVHYSVCTGFMWTHTFSWRNCVFTGNFWSEREMLIVSTHSPHIVSFFCVFSFVNDVAVQMMSWDCYCDTRFFKVRVLPLRKTEPVKVCTCSFSLLQSRQLCDGVCVYSIQQHTDAFVMFLIRACWGWIVLPLSHSLFLLPVTWTDLFLCWILLHRLRS